MKRLAILFTVLSVVFVAPMVVLALLIVLGDRIESYRLAGAVILVLAGLLSMVASALAWDKVK